MLQKVLPYTFDTFLDCDDEVVWPPDVASTRMVVLPFFFPNRWLLSTSLWVLALVSKRLRWPLAVPFSCCWWRRRWWNKSIEEELCRLTKSDLPAFRDFNAIGFRPLFSLKVENWANQNQLNYSGLNLEKCFNQSKGREICKQNRYKISKADLTVLWELV